MPQAGLNQRPHDGMTVKASVVRSSNSAAAAAAAAPAPCPPALAHAGANRQSKLFETINRPRQESVWKLIARSIDRKADATDCPEEADWGSTEAAQKPLEARVDHQRSQTHKRERTLLRLLTTVLSTVPSYRLVTLDAGFDGSPPLRQAPAASASPAAAPCAVQQKLPTSKTSFKPQAMIDTVSYAPTICI